jgi:hypothetical protein
MCRCAWRGSAGSSGQEGSYRRERREQCPWLEPSAWTRPGFASSGRWKAARAGRQGSRFRRPSRRPACEGERSLSQNLEKQSAALDLVGTYCMPLRGPSLNHSSPGKNKQMERATEFLNSTATKI